MTGQYFIRDAVTIPLMSGLTGIPHPFSCCSPFFRSAQPVAQLTGSISNPVLQAARPYQNLPGRDGIVSIEFVKHGERARNVISRSNTRATGRYPSMRMRRNIEWDSPHELNAYRLLDTNPFVLEFSEQPCVIRYRLNGDEHRHYPDSLIRTKDSKFLWEVKTKADASRPEVQERTRLMVDQLPSYGFQYSVQLAEDLSREPRLKNVRLLLRLGRCPLSFEQLEFSRKLLSQVTSVTWGDIAIGRLAPFNLEHACRLVLDNVLYLNLDERICSTTIISPVPTRQLLGGTNG